MQKSYDEPAYEHVQSTEPPACRSELWSLAEINRVSGGVSFEWLLDHFTDRVEAVR